MRKIFTLFAVVFLSFGLTAQTLSLGSFNKSVLEENFNSQQNHFPLSTTTDNYFIVDDGDFFLSRNHADAEYSIFASQPLTLVSYRIKTALKLGPSNNKEAHIGVLLNTQLDGSGAVAIEVNSKKQYRLRQITNGKTKYISGTRSDDGWVRSDVLKGLEEFNYLDVVSHQGSFDLYWNHQYIASYSVPEYQSGGLGFMVGAATKARVDFIHVYKQGEAVSYEEFTTASNKVLELEESLRQLKEVEASLQLSTKNAEATLAKANSEISQLEGLSEGIKIQLQGAQEQITSLNNSSDLLKKEKNTLQQSVNDLTTKNSGLAKNISNKENDIDGLINQLTDLKERKETISEKLATTESSLNSVKNKNEQLKGENSKKANSINNLNAQVAQLNISKSDLSTQLATATNELKSTNTQLKSKNNQIEALQGKFTNEQMRTADLNDQLTSIKKQVNEKQKIISSLSRKNNAYIDSLSDLRDANKALTTTQEQLKATRITLSSTQEFAAKKLKEIEVLNAQLKEQKQIAAQFAESYRVESRKNGQLQQEITFAQNEIDVSSTSNKSSTIYRVQIGTFDDEMDFDGITDVTSIPTRDGKFIYITGKFTTYSDAKMRLMKVSELGYKNAYIVKF